MPMTAARALLLCSVLLGCASADRLGRSMPAMSPTVAENRVNLWPLVYANADLLAILWPIYDQDARGFALRPLLTKDGSTWEVLPPLCFFDTGSGDWFVVPAYHFGDSHGLFPLYNRGWLNNAGPIFWTEDEQGRLEKGGLFPVVLLGPRFNYAGPAWWTRNPEGELQSSGLFPVARFGDGFNYATLAYWNEADGEVHSGGLFPVCHFGPRLSFVGPGFWTKGPDGEIRSGGLFPISYLSSDFSYAGPVFWNKDATGDVASGGLFPIAWIEGDHGYAGPIYWTGDSGGLLALAHFGPKSNFVGPAWWHFDAEGAVDYSGFFPIATLTPTFNHVGLLYWYYDDIGNARWSGLFPIANFGPSFGHVGPVVWLKDENGEVEHIGLPPLTWFGPRFGFVGPGWWTRDAAGDVDAGGLFPIADFSSTFNHIGPAIWIRNDAGEIVHSGLFPLAWSGPDFGYAGPAFWTRDATGAVDGGGLFPLVTLTDAFNNVGPVLWGRHPDGALKFFTVPLLYHHRAEESGAGRFLSPLVSRGWTAAGETAYLNVLGALYHYNRVDDGYFTYVTPFFVRTETSRRSRLDVWPLVGREELRDDTGKPVHRETDVLAGLVHHEGVDGTDRFRMIPFVSYRSADGGRPDVSDWLSIYAHKSTGEDGVDLSVLSPLVFHYEEDAEETKWHGPLGSVSYSRKGDTSEFSLLYYLYRHKTEGSETRRDLFPFITWDTGEERSGFSFLWRLFRYERKGDAVSGHVLFIPW